MSFFWRSPSYGPASCGTWPSWSAWLSCRMLSPCRVRFQLAELSSRFRQREVEETNARLEARDGFSNYCLNFSYASSRTSCACACCMQSGDVLGHDAKGGATAERGGRVAARREDLPMSCGCLCLFLRGTPTWRPRPRRPRARRHFRLHSAPHSAAPVEAMEREEELQREYDEFLEISRLQPAGCTSKPSRMLCVPRLM